MELEFKPDFEDARQAWRTFWDGTNSRPMILASRPKPNTAPVPQPKYLDCFDGDLWAIADQLLAWGETHEFLADTIPFYYLEFGPDTFAAYLGADLRLSADRYTSWSAPFVEHWDEVEIKLDRNGYWWQRTLEAIAILRERCDGKLLICPPTLVANLDALAAIRGIQALLTDLIDCPEQVAHALEGVCRVHTEIMDAFAQALDFATYGSINIEGAYIAGRQSRPQCDMSCMIGPAMFRQFVVPCLNSEAHDADAFVYHLDGPGALKHVDALCEMAALDVIAWVPGAGNEHKDWSALYNRIDQRNKGQLFYACSHAAIKSRWRQYQSRKLIFQTHFDAKAAAADLLGELTSLHKGDGCQA